MNKKSIKLLPSFSFFALMAILNACQGVYFVFIFKENEEIEIASRFLVVISLHVNVAFKYFKCFYSALMFHG